jgi:hypothetical protein
MTCALRTWPSRCFAPHHRAIQDQRPYLAYGDSFDLLSATVRLTVDVTIDAEDPAGV